MGGIGFVREAFEVFGDHLDRSVLVKSPDLRVWGVVMKLGWSGVSFKGSSGKR